MTTKIRFKGKEYSSVDEMPPDVRQAYEMVKSLFADRNQDGKPDLLENIASMQSAMTNVIIHNGQTYSGMDQMPPEVRQLYEQAMARLADNDGNGIPDVLERAGFMTMQTSQLATSADPAAPMPSMPPMAPAAPPAPPMASTPSVPVSTPVSASPYTPAITGDVDDSGRNLRLLIIGGALVLLLAAIAGLLGVVVYMQYFAGH